MERKTYLKTKREAAHHLGVSQGSIEKLMRIGLPYVRVGNLVRFRPEDLAEFIDRQRVRRADLPTVCSTGTEAAQ